MSNPLLRKLEALADLSTEDRQLVDSICTDVHDFHARQDIIREKERLDHVHLMLSGWASRYQIMAHGKKQITAILLPGDFCDTLIALLGEMDHSIGANMTCRVAFVSKDTMLALFDRPAIARALWWASLVDEGIMRAWLVNLGARDGLPRTAHLLCELHARLTAIGMADGDFFTVPLTQEQLGQALSLTAVHVNRILRQLRDRGMVRFERNRVSIVNEIALRALCNYNPSYLHLNDKR